MSELEKYKKALEMLESIQINEIEGINLCIFCKEDNQLNISNVEIVTGDGLFENDQLDFNDFLKNLIRGNVNLFLDTTIKNIKKVIEGWKP